MSEVQTAIPDDVDVSRDRYSGYSSQTAYQNDLRKFFDGKICGALTNERRFCGSTPMANGRCRLHGGASPNGLDHPRTTHGNYSNYLPEALMKKYKEAESNEELLSLRQEAALITARIYELAEKINDSAGKRRYTELLSAYKRWQSAIRKGLDVAPMMKIDFEDILEEIKEDLQIWDEVGNMVNLKRRIVDSEQKKMNNLQQYVPVDKVMLLIGALMDTVVNEVEALDGMLMDENLIEKTNTKIAKKFSKITKRNSEDYNPE